MLRTKNKKEKTMKKKNGRPSKLTKELIGKLETAASLDCTIKEMCFYSGINPDTYYEWIKKDKKLSDRITALRNTPVLMARQELCKGLKGNPELSLKYLERKRPNEFSPKQLLEHSGKIDVPIRINYEPVGDSGKKGRSSRRKSNKCISKK